MSDDLPEDPVERAATLRARKGRTRGNSNAADNSDGGDGGHGGECPMCGEGYPRDLPAHLVGCPEA